MNWDRLTIAVVGGDEREQEITRQAAATGAAVRAFGFPGSDVYGVGSVAEALTAADVLLLPIPGIALDSSIFAPAHPEPIVITEDLLRLMSPRPHLILGRVDAALRTAAAAVDALVDEYEDDQELMLLRAPAIVEGVIRVAIENTAMTINDARAVVVGYGNIGGRLAASLRALGAHVTVAARNPVQRAAAYAAHLDAVSVDQLPFEAMRTDMIFSTVPAAVVDHAVLSRLRPGALVVDVAAPPGGVDLDAATRLGHRAVWARGMGRRAPITVGGSQWRGIRARIERAQTAVTT